MGKNFFDILSSNNLSSLSMLRFPEVKEAEILKPNQFLESISPVIEENKHLFSLAVLFLTENLLS